MNTLNLRKIISVNEKLPDENPHQLEKHELILPKFKIDGSTIIFEEEFEDSYIWVKRRTPVTMKVQ